MGITAHLKSFLSMGIGRNGHEPVESTLDVNSIRKHFLFPQSDRIVTNNAATTQVPVDLLRMHTDIARDYENVHRGQSRPSKVMTRLFEESYDTVAGFLNAPAGKKNIVFYRSTTEAINSVMYCLMTEFRDGDNILTTMMEHNSNYVPWYAMCQEILPRLGKKVECRIAKFHKHSGQLDLNQMSDLIDKRTKLVCCSGASNFLGTRNPICEIRNLARESGYVQPDGVRGSYLLLDAAQLVPGSPVDVQALDVDFLAFSFHKMLAPFGIGVLYAKERILDSLLPFLYGGDMIALGEVSPQRVGYNDLPWKYTAGTPNILGAIVSAQAIRLLIDFAKVADKHIFFGSNIPISREIAGDSMTKIDRYLTSLTEYAMGQLAKIPGIEIYGPEAAHDRISLVAFNIDGWSPLELAEELSKYGVEARAGCHCATLAHHYLGLDPPASCRLSFYLYNTFQDIDIATSRLSGIASGRALFGPIAADSKRSPGDSEFSSKGKFLREMFSHKENYAYYTSEQESG